MRNARRLMVLWTGFIILCCTNLSAQERWVYRYNGPGNDWDWANSIVMGSDSNLYAAGATVGSGTLDDFTVISLTPSGGERWTYRYNGAGNDYDYAYSIVTGLDSNLYAAGATTGSGTSGDFTVISLTLSGGERWVYRYNGSGNSDDGANSIVMGSDTNLYAAGWSIGSGTSADFTVISLTPLGGERWVYRYDGPVSAGGFCYSIVTGSDGNLYAAGASIGSGTSADFTVISLTPSGGERWVYSYNGPGNWDEFALSIVMGSDSNLYAAGWSGESGNFGDFTVISLDTSGAERWVYRYNGPGSWDDWAFSIVMGSDGNVYAAGWSGGSGNQYDFMVISLTSSGGERWVYRYNGPANYDDAAYSIVMGPDANLYAAGMTVGSTTWADFTVISLDTSGVGRWIYSYNGPGNDYDGAFSIVMGSDGNLYAAGESAGNGTSSDFTVISLTPDVGVQERPACPEGSGGEAGLELSACPTPALGGVNIHYYLPKAAEVKLAIYNSSGRSVKNLVNGAEEIGSKSVFWDGRDENGEVVPSGTYFCLLTQGGFTATTKVILLR